MVGYRANSAIPFPRGGGRRVPVVTSAEVYERVAAAPPGTTFRYTLQKDGETLDVGVPSMPSDRRWELLPGFVAGRGRNGWSGVWLPHRGHTAICDHEAIDTFFMSP